MAFDIFSQPQGPTISPSLFGDAATQGAQQASRIPSVATSIVEGVKAGVKDYVDISKGINEVNQIPVENQIRETQLKNEQAIATINTQKADLAVKTQQLTLEDTSAELANKTGKANQEIQNRDAIAAFKKQVDALSPSEQLTLLKSGTQQGFFNENPKEFESFLKGIYANEKVNGMTAEEKDTIGTILKRTKASDPWAQDAIAHQKAYNKAFDNITNSDTPTGLAVGTMAKKLQALPTDIPDLVKPYPSGGFLKNDAGTALMKDGRGNFIKLPTTKEMLNGKSDYVTPDGNIVYPDADQKVVDGIAAFAVEHNRRNYPEIAANKVSKKDTTQVEAQTSGPFDSSQTQGEKGPDPVDKAFQSKLHLDDATFEAVREPIGRLKATAIAVASDSSNSNAVEAQNTIDKAVSYTARTITDTQFENNKDIQLKYNDDAVRKYNDLKKDDMVKSFGGSGFASAKTGIGLPPELTNAFKVSTPKDLYFVNQRQALEAQLKSLTDDLITTLQNQQLVTAKGIDTKRKNQVLLIAQSQGAPNG